MRFHNVQGSQVLDMPMCGYLWTHCCFGLYKHHWIQVECSSHFNLGCYTGVGSESRVSPFGWSPWIQTYSDINVWRPRRFCLKRFRIYRGFSTGRRVGMKLWLLNATLLELVNLPSKYTYGISMNTGNHILYIPCHIYNIQLDICVPMFCRGIQSSDPSILCSGRLRQGQFQIHLQGLTLQWISSFWWDHRLQSSPAT